MAISNCGADERGRYTGGQPGDQTGKEWAIIPFYKRPWTVILRYPNKDIARDIADLARSSALNDHVGYSQGDRMAYYSCLKAADWEPSRIVNDCSADCSSGVAAIIVATGHRNNIVKLRDLSPSLTTKNMRKALTAAGFTAHSDGVYTGSDRFLLPGDVLLCENHHVAINLDKGDGDYKYMQVAMEVKSGEWGNGASRKNALMDAGWDYATVQAEVNILSW